MNMDQTLGNSNLTSAAPAGAALTMSSREIADLVEKRHDHVMRDIKKMLAELGEAAPKFGGSYLGADGTSRPCFDLPKDLTLTLIAGYNVKLRKRIIDRWQELEDQRANGGFHLPDFTDPAEGARAWAEQFERNKALQIESAAKDSQIAAMQPKVDEYEAYLSEEGVCRVMDFCNKHGVKKNYPGYALRSKGMLHQKKLLATQVGLRTGTLKNILNKDNFEYIDSKGQSVEAQQAMITRSGEAAVLRMIVDGYGMTAFRNPTAFDRAVSLIGGAV